MNNLFLLLPIYSKFISSSLCSYSLYDVWKDEEVSDIDYKVSINIPTYNEECFIEESLKSIMNQNIIKYGSNRDMFDIVLIDSESDDNTVDIAKDYVDEVVIDRSHNILYARHLGVEKSKGDIILCCNADIIYPINWANLMLKYYSNKNIVGVSGPFINMDLFFKDALLLFNTFIRYIYRHDFHGGNSSFRKDAYYKAGGFDYDKLNTKDHLITYKYECILFREKLARVGKVIYDIRLGVEHYGGSRRLPDFVLSKICSGASDSCLCNFYKERKNKERF